MRDPLDETLAEAGQFLRDDDGVDAALVALVDARADEARVATKPRRTRAKLLPTLAIGAALAVVGGGAVAATQWGPWTYVPEPDIVIVRDWSDVSGDFLGSCESRLKVNSLPGEAYDLAIGYLDAIDVDTVQPDPEWVAGLLHAVGRLDDVGRLVPGAVPSDFSPGGDGWSGPALEYFSDARVLQDSLTQAVFNGMAAKIRERDEFRDLSDLTSRVETQCTTDPGRTGEQ